MNRWLEEFATNAHPSHHQNHQKRVSEVLGLADRAISPKCIVDVVDVSDHFHERAGTLGFDGECPRELAGYVAVLETLQWWLQLQHPEILAQWVRLVTVLQK